MGFRAPAGTLAVGAAYGVIAVLGLVGAGQVTRATLRTDAADTDGRHPGGARFRQPRRSTTSPICSSVPCGSQAATPPCRLGAFAVTQRLVSATFRLEGWHPCSRKKRGQRFRWPRCIALDDPHETPERSVSNRSRSVHCHFSCATRTTPADRRWQE
jgi:hypothetical protein